MVAAMRSAPEPTTDPPDRERSRRASLSRPRAAAPAGRRGILDLDDTARNVDLPRSLGISLAGDSLGLQGLQPRNPRVCRAAVDPECVQASLDPVAHASAFRAIIVRHHGARSSILCSPKRSTPTWWMPSATSIPLVAGLRRFHDLNRIEGPCQRSIGFRQDDPRSS